MAKGTKIFESGGLYKDLPGGGRALTAQLSQVKAGINQRPDLFIKKGKNVGKTKLAEGYSFKPGKGMTLVDTISYRGNETYSGGTFNVYGPAAQSTAPPDDGGGGGGDDGGGGSGGGPGSSPGSDGGAAETIDPYQGIEFPDYSDQFSGMNTAISNLSTTFTDQLTTLTNQMTADRKAADDRMAEMQQSFQQQLAARRDRPRVSGIRFADRGTGGRSSSQLLRRGVRGTFGRSGDRLMKISSLNI